LPVKTPHDPHHNGLRSFFTQASSQLPNPKSKKYIALHTRNQSKESLEEAGGQHVLKLRLSNNSLIVEQRPAGGSSNLADYGYPYITNENPYYDTHKVEEGPRTKRKGQHTTG
jgi:hypothetical protein